MAILKRLIAWTSIALWSAPVMAKEHTPTAPIELTVSVFNDAGLPRNVLDAAKSRTTFIFSKANISVTWLDCGESPKSRADRGCSEIEFPEHLSLRLVRSLPAASEETFGQSFLDAEGVGSYAYVYAVALRSPSTAQYLREGELLGNVMAHEVGHLLLGLNSHSPFGLMAARWEPAQLQQAAKGHLLFSPGEADRIRSRYVWAVARARAGAARSPATVGD